VEYEPTRFTFTALAARRCMNRGGAGRARTIFAFDPLFAARGRRSVERSRRVLRAGAISVCGLRDFILGVRFVAAAGG